MQTGNFTVENGVLVKYHGKEKRPTLPEGITEIGNCAFYSNDFIESITIPEGVTVIGEEAFRRCKNLCEIIFPSTLEAVRSHAFERCSSLLSVTLPVSARSFGQAVFEWCSSLWELSAEGAEEIGDFFAAHCTSLQRVVLSERLHRLSRYAFYDCSALKELALTGRFTKIEDCAFEGCAALTAITLPCTVLDIGEKAFADCVSLPSFVCPERLERIGEKAFYGCAALASFTPSPCLYQINDTAFYSCDALKERPTPAKIPTAFCVFDRSRNMPFADLPEEMRVCYRPSVDGALSIDGIGSFSLSPCTEEEYGVLMEACNLWRIERSSSSGSDANYDSGNYNVEHFTTYANCYPENCLLADGEVLGFVDAEGRYFLIGKSSDEWTADHSTSWATHDHVDCTTYSLVRR